uniref:Pentatricopeptide repeat-containing protein n=1 Tax=Chenopodium quinoa TaxID=63459 RepID=A0A803N7D6_CHEQI
MFFFLVLVVLRGKLLFPLSLFCSSSSSCYAKTFTEIMGFWNHHLRLLPHRKHTRLRTISYFLSSCRFFTTLKISNGENGETVEEISKLLKHNNWSILMGSSDIIKKLNPDVVQSVLHHNQFSDPIRLLGFFNWSHSQLGIHHNLFSFSILAVLLCNSSCFPLANGVIECLIETRPPSYMVFDSLASCVREYNKCDSSSVIFDIVINAYKKMGLLKEAADVFLCIKDNDFCPSLVCCNSLLSDLLKKNMMGLFWRVYNTMLEVNLVPDIYTYTNLISGLCKEGKVEEGKNVIVEMEEKGIIPNLVTYNVLINGLCRSKALDEALELKRSMAEKGLTPDSYTYSILIDGFCKNKRAWEAKLLLAEMVGRGLKPNHVTYTSLIDGFMKQGDVIEALKIKDEMTACGIKLNFVTYAALIWWCYCRENKMEAAYELLAEMKNMNFSPTAFTFNAIINALCHVRNVQCAYNVLQEMAICGVKPNVVTYTTLIKGYIHGGEAISYFDEMVERGLKPDAYTYGALIHGYCKDGEMKIASRYLEEMSRCGIKPNDVVYAAFIDGHCKEGNIAEALSSFEEDMLRQKVLPDLLAYSVLIHRLAKKWKDAGSFAGIHRT